jgi:hypothetical protein
LRVGYDERIERIRERKRPGLLVTIAIENLFNKYTDYDMDLM